MPEKAQRTQFSTGPLLAIVCDAQIYDFPINRSWENGEGRETGLCGDVESRWNLSTCARISRFYDCILRWGFKFWACAQWLFTKVIFFLRTTLILYMNLFNASNGACQIVGCTGKHFNGNTFGNAINLFQFTSPSIISNIALN